MFLKIRFYCIRMAFFITIVAIGLLLTGAAKRDYTVLGADANITLSGTDFELTDLAAKYLPTINISEATNKGQLNNIFFEVIEENQQVVINYYFRWSGENNPNLLANLASKIWRLIYYRFVLSDVEFLQLNIDKNTSQIKEAKVKNGSVTNTSQNLCIAINSWNHDFDFCQSETPQPTNFKSLLSYFNDSEYKHLKMARRSQGDYKTNDNVMNYPFIIFLALLATYYFRHLQKDYNNEYVETV